jgi:glucose-1-phosphate adenylyltransferase
MPPPRPLGRAGPAGYLGTADAVFQNLVHRPVRDSDVVAVFSADHIYRMDVRPFVQHHLEQGADVSIAVIPVPVRESSHFGVVETDASGRTVALHEKPNDPLPMPGRPSHALASMGNYLFRAAALKQALQACCACGRFDFGNDVLPYLMQRAHVVAYDFESHAVPGLRAGEEPSYWRDVGTLDAYFRAQLDTLGPSPRIALDNVLWPLAPQHSVLPSAQVWRGESRNSRLGAGALIDQACVDQTLVGENVRVLADAQLSRCVLFDGVTIGPAAQLRKVIVAEGNAVPAAERIGYDESEDRERFAVSAGGVVVVPPHHFRTDAREPHIVEMRWQSIV